MGFPEAKWAVDQIVGKLGIAPNDMRKFEARSLNATSIGLKFLEPLDSLYSVGGAKANTVAGVVIRMGVDDYPSNPNEGSLVVDNKVIGRYENEPFVVENLSQGTTYYFSAFPYTTAGVYNESPSGANRAVAIPLPGEVVDVVVNINDMEEFTNATVTLHNLTDGTDESINVTKSGTYTFVAKSHEQFKVTVSNVDKYSVDKTESETFTAVPGETRSFTFNYTYQRGETVTVNVAINDTSEFQAATVTLNNTTTGESEQKTVTGPGSVSFVVPIGNVYTVSMGAVDKYMLDRASYGPYTAQLAGTRSVTFNYTYQQGELINVAITVDNAQEFTPVTITAQNLTDGTNETKTLSAAGSVSFLIDPGKRAKITVTKPEKYKVDKTQTDEFTTVLGGTRNFTFAYTYSPAFHLTIEFDNGSDGIPASFTYKDDCAGFTPASGATMNSWAGHEILDFFKPCVIKPGMAAPEYYLLKDNYTKKADGVTNSVLTGNDGDVMVEVGRLYYKVYNAAGGRIGLTISNGQDDGFFPFNDVAGVDVEYRYRAVYEAFNQGGQMRSISGVTPTVSQTRAVFRSQAKARGAEYSQNDYSLVFLWECMYILLYGSRASQSVLGAGRTNGSNSACVQTGTMDARPFCWGDAGGVNGVKFLGVEHFYGDLWEFVDGITADGDNIYITRDPAKYSDDHANYETGPLSMSACTSGQYVTAVQGVKDAIFLPKATNGGSEATFFCDCMWKSTGIRVVSFGGYWSNAGAAGAFCWLLSNAVSASYSNFGSRLCRKKVVS